MTKEEWKKYYNDLQKTKQPKGLCKTVRKYYLENQDKLREDLGIELKD